MRRPSMDKSKKVRRMILGRDSECYARGLSTDCDEFAIERGVPCNHVLNGELGEDALAARFAHPPAERIVVQQPVRAARELEAIAERHEVSGSAIDHQIA